MVSITGLEFAYTQAPKKMKSTIMGFWLLNVTMGSLLVVLLAVRRARVLHLDVRPVAGRGRVRLRAVRAARFRGA